MRKAHPLLLAATLLITAAASPQAFAQPSDTANTQAQDNNVFSPSAPTLPLLHQPLAASGAIVTQPGDWKAANAAVAEFPRGHADVLKWEKAQRNSEKSADQATQIHENKHGGQR